MKTYSYDNGFGTTYTFEVVDKIPEGYEVWNINFDNMCGFIPLCKCYEGTYNVITSALKAIYVEDKKVRDIIKKAISWGMNADGVDKLAEEWGICDNVEELRQTIAEAVKILEVLK